MTEDMPDFNSLANPYERFAEPLTSRFCERAAVLSGVGSNEQVIDVATGTGALALIIAAMGARVLATDIAPAMVARTSERLRPFPECEARVMDGASLDAGDASFDAAFSIFGVMLFASWRAGLAEMVRVVRANGRVVVAAWPSRVGATPMVILDGVFSRVFPGRSLWGENGLNEWSQTSLRGAVIESGCSDVTVTVCETIQSAASVDALLEEFGPLFHFAPNYAALTDEQHARLQPALKAAFQAYAESDGSINLPSSALIAVGRKSK
ncbi:ubiquinone/menaquinone biosynthesis C-methylase UbiE [Paraburkholderia sp. Clong3]|uniref:class I SAM-dependent methyltransferase n=1 Tax=Paraburkholderia sp. Clong3 TaxID=2991061 RepID=UPI003D1A3106